MTDARIILTTIGSRDGAGQLAQQLVERRLAACVNIVGPIRSVYRWKQRIEHEEEYLLLIKSTGAQTAPLQAAIEELHPYELPECLVLAADAGSAGYLAWLAGEVKGNEC
jgi:periplasmic divalent cation tolerance protein